MMQAGSTEPEDLLGPGPRGNQTDHGKALEEVPLTPPPFCSRHRAEGRPDQPPPP